MKITQEKHQFAPITLVIESLAELQAITYGVGRNSVTNINEVANDRDVALQGSAPLIADKSDIIYNQLNTILKGLE